MADDREMLGGFLDWQRAVVQNKVDGMALDLATRVMTPTGLSALGIVQHLGYVERQWFQEVFAGRDVEKVRVPGDNSPEFVIEPGTTVESVLEHYHRECDEARSIAATAASLDQLSVGSNWFYGHVSLRWILVHMIEETARHAGHLDMMCEQLDGRTGD